MTTVGEYSAEEQFHRPDGTAVWVNLFAKAVDRHDLSQGIIWTIIDISKRKYNVTMTNLLHSISNAISTTTDLNDLYKRIHGLLNDNIYAPNFFVGLLDDQRTHLEFTYFEDEMDDLKGCVFDIKNPSSSSLSVEVIRSGRPLLVARKKLPSMGKMIRNPRLRTMSITYSVRIS